MKIVGTQGAASECWLSEKPEIGHIPYRAAAPTYESNMVQTVLSNRNGKSIHTPKATPLRSVDSLSIIRRARYGI